MTKKYLAGIIIICCSMLITSCQDKKFDSNKWCDMDSTQGNTRNQMLKDVLGNHLKKGKHFKEISHLLCGEGTFVNLEKDQPGVVIEIIVEYQGIDPISKKSLYVYLDNDSIIKKIEIREK